MPFLTVEQVLEIHGEVIRLHGGDPAIHDIAPGIYEFKGDTVVLCLNSEKSERPAKFARPRRRP